MKKEVSSKRWAVVDKVFGEWEGANFQMYGIYPKEDREQVARHIVDHDDFFRSVGKNIPKIFDFFHGHPILEQQLLNKNYKDQENKTVEKLIKQVREKGVRYHSFDRRGLYVRYTFISAAVDTLDRRTEMTDERYRYFARRLINMGAEIQDTFPGAQIVDRVWLNQVLAQEVLQRGEVSPGSIAAFIENTPPTKPL